MRRVLSRVGHPVGIDLDRESLRDHDAYRDKLMATAEALPFADDTFDTVVSTLVLCTVDDPARSLSEIARVLRPGGQLLYVEHLRSDSERWGRWQDRLERPWAAFAGGCRCNRRTLDLMAVSPLRVEEPARANYRGMPRLMRPLAVGRAELPR
jgi:ubiquinone/menaquinone biosynthesis C-methylase UbiE